MISTQFPDDAPSVSWRDKSVWLPLLLALFVGVVMYFSNPKPNFFYDYTWRIAGALWRGELGLKESPGQWLNELVPFNGWLYSVFPLGSVVTMMPLALFRNEFPTAFLAGFCGAATTWFAFGLAGLFGDGTWRRVRLALLPVLGSWMWCNVAFEGAWQIALGFAVVGQFGALYFTLVKPRPILAGAFFALGFGNRTEVILTAPFFLYLFWRAQTNRVLDGKETPQNETLRPQTSHAEISKSETSKSETSREVFQRQTLRFCAIPFVLGMATLLYNYARFGSFTDFGYARIPGVLQEENYKYGIFSLHAIPNNIQKMLLDGWRHWDAFPYWTPNGFGGSLLLSCPFLLMLLWPGSRDRVLARTSWIAIAILTFVLWIHGDPGGWQYSYRYAMVLLPWLFLVLTAQKTTVRTKAWAETFLLVLSLAINAWATYLFYWTTYVKA